MVSGWVKRGECVQMSMFVNLCVSQVAFLLIEKCFLFLGERKGSCKDQSCNCYLSSVWHKMNFLNSLSFSITMYTKRMTIALNFLKLFGVIDLKCCVTSRCTAKWFRCTTMCIFVFSVFSTIGYSKITGYSTLRCTVCPLCFIYSHVYETQRVWVNLKLLIYPSHCFPFGNHKFVFYVCKSISIL